MIEAYVYTNQDDVDCFVKKFLALPRVGDKITVKYKGKEVDSSVMGVTHRLTNDGVPYVTIEVWSEQINRSGGD